MANYTYVDVQLETLLVRVTKEDIYNTGLGIATAIGLPVSSWQAGEPTRSVLLLESDILGGSLEDLANGYVGSGFLDTAEGVWLTQQARQQFGVNVVAATYATTDVTLTNAGGGLYEIEPGDLTFKSTISGKTYRNTTGGTLSPGPGTTLDVTVVAEESGSDSSAGEGEIDDMVTTLLGVTCSNDDAAVGIDEQDPDVTRQQCRDKLGNLSPNGPADIYAYVARDPEKSGTTAVKRVRSYSSSDTGDVTVYLAGPSGAVTEADRALVEAAYATWATPLCVTVTTLAATEVIIPVTYELWLYKRSGVTTDEAEEAIEAALEQMFARRPIGGDVIEPDTGKIYTTLIESTIRSVYPGDAFRVSVTQTVAGTSTEELTAVVSATDTDLGEGEVAVLGTVTATIHLVKDPA